MRAACWSLTILACLAGCSEILDDYRSCGPEPADSCGDSCDGCYLNHLYTCRDGEWELVAVCEHFPSWDGPTHEHVVGPIHLELEVADQTAACDRPPPSELNLLVRDAYPEVELGEAGDVLSYEINETPAGGGQVVTVRVLPQAAAMTIAARIELGGSVTGAGTATYASTGGTCTIQLHIASGTYETEQEPGAVEDSRRVCSLFGCAPAVDL